MQTYKNVLLIIFIIIELLAVFLFVINELNEKAFFFIELSMALMIGLYFMDIQRTKKIKKQ
jgi:hypothetical protein